MKFTMLAAPLMILYMAVIYLNFADYQRETWTNMQERHLDIAINYAVDAAIDRMTEDSSDLGLDYQWFESVNADPQLALDMYKLIMLKNLQYSINENNYAYIEGCTPLFVVATYDGYYMAREREVNEEGSYRLTWNPKMPYYYQKNVGGVDYLYALNLGLEDALRWYSNDDGAKCERVFIDGVLTANEQKSIISSCISDDMMVALWDIRGGSEVSQTLYVPSDMTTWTSTNPINSTTVLAYVDGIDLGNNTSYSAFGIGGSRIVHEEFVVCYEKGGKKLYIYATDVPEGVTILESFENPVKAAEAGYQFDMDYFN